VASLAFDALLPAAVTIPLALSFRLCELQAVQMATVGCGISLLNYGRKALFQDCFQSINP
jgi:hypothetical protein